MFYYSQIDNEGYCIGISQLTEDVKSDNMIPIEEYNTKYLGRKYDVKKKQWADEYLPKQEKKTEEPTLEDKVAELQTSVDILILRQEGVIA